MLDISFQAAGLLLSLESPDTLVFKDIVDLFQRFTTCLLEEEEYVESSGNAECSEYAIDLELVLDNRPPRLIIRAVPLTFH